MEEKKTDLNGALKWIGDMFDQTVTQFLVDYKQLPSFGDPNLDAEVVEYVDGMANWVRGNNEWSFEVRSASSPTFVYANVCLIM
jgi:hypothetical protein